MWEAAHPAALGWLLDTTAAVLSALPGTEAPEGETMADFARVLLALDRLWGTDGYGLWKASQQDLYQEVLESDPVAMSIAATIRCEVTVTPGALLKMLTASGTLDPPRPGTQWTPRSLSGAMKRVTGPLQKNGWTVTQGARDSHDKSIRWTIRPPAGTPYGQPLGSETRPDGGPLSDTHGNPVLRWKRLDGSYGY
jgi:hypothetical protein